MSEHILSCNIIVLIQVCLRIFVTESAKTGLICTKHTYSFYHIYLFFCVGYMISVTFIEFVRNFVYVMKCLIKYHVRKKSYLV